MIDNDFWFKLRLVVLVFVIGFAFYEIWRKWR